MVFLKPASGNIAYNLLKESGTADTIGPILPALNKPVHILQLDSSVRDILNMALIAVADARIKSKTAYCRGNKKPPPVEAI